VIQHLPYSTGDQVVKMYFIQRNYWYAWVIWNKYGYL